jgi:hypothetical protein
VTQPSRANIVNPVRLEGLRGSDNAIRKAGR